MGWNVAASWVLGGTRYTFGGGAGPITSADTSDILLVVHSDWLKSGFDFYRADHEHDSGFLAFKATSAAFEHKEGMR